jgi:RNA polymerase sigma factor (sigma-70 family)
MVVDGTRDTAVRETRAIDATDEAALTRRLRAQEPEAYAELFARFAPGLFRFCTLHLAGDALTAEELVVETFAAAAGDIERFDPRRATLTTWLYGIARRRVHQHLRLLRRRKSVPPAAQVPIGQAAEAGTEADPAEALAARLDAQRQVRRIASVLSDLELEVLVLSAVEGLSAREIGRIVRRSERAIHSILHRARRKARERLVQDG